MSDSTYCNVASANNLATSMELISNNLANASTVGFKRDNIVFESLLPKQPEQSSGALGGSFNMEPPLQDIIYSGVINKYTDFSQGALKDTGIKTDVAIEGQGFFKIQSGADTYYTRDGSFMVNSQGVLCTKHGCPVLGRSGEIRINDPNFSITNKGEIVQGGKTSDVFELVECKDPKLLEKIGSNLYRAQSPDLMTPASEDCEMYQGRLELSNVNVVKNLTEMLAISRLYEAYSKNIQNINKINTRAAVEIAKV